MKLDDAAARLEALGNPTRLRIYRTLVRAGATGLEHIDQMVRQRAHAGGAEPRRWRQKVQVRLRQRPVRKDRDDRVLTFANGMEARERILAVDEAQQRVVYSVISEQMSYHRASATVTTRADGQTEFTWTAQVAPPELAPGMDEMMEVGAAAIKRTLEAAAAEF